MEMSESKIDRVQSLWAICGVIGPIAYATVVITLGMGTNIYFRCFPILPGILFIYFFQIGYNPVTQSMSELGAVGAPNAIIMNILGFALLGFLMISFSFGLHGGISKGKGSKFGPVLVAISGAALVMTGIFPCDPSCVDISLGGITHSVFAIIAAFALILAPLFLLQRLKKDDRWQGYVVYSMVTVVVALVLSAIYGLNVFEQWQGLLQRLSMGVPLLWIDIMAIKLLILSIRSSSLVNKQAISSSWLNLIQRKNEPFISILIFYR